MASRTNRKARNVEFRTRDETASDDDMERFPKDHRAAVETKLRQAAESVARGEAKPLEPLGELLREARKRFIHGMRDLTSLVRPPR
jgi:hypothetical protein